MQCAKLASSQHLLVGMEDSPGMTSHSVAEAPRRTILERLSSFLLRQPEDRDQLVELLHSAYEKQLLDADALQMIEGVLGVSELKVRDVMLPRSQMDMIDVADTPEQFIPMVIETAHSRFPVYENGKDNVIGILLAKDLLRYYADADEFDVRDMLRPAVFVPESKRLNVLLRDFKANRNHIAIVVDEYGGVAGLVTIEDVLEQIVGEIEDEFDFDETEDNILPDKSGRFRVKAITEIGDFNAHFGCNFSDSDFDTVGGLVINQFGRVPKRGEIVTFDGFRFAVLRADSRKVHSLIVERLASSLEGSSPPVAS
jgi:magnesium and cobalt transporter